MPTPGTPTQMPRPMLQRFMGQVQQQDGGGDVLIQQNEYNPTVEYFVMQLLKPPSWLFSVSTALLVTDLLHLVGQYPHWTLKICLVPVPYNSCICGGVIPMIIVHIPQCTLIFVVLSSFRI